MDSDPSLSPHSEMTASNYGYYPLIDSWGTTFKLTWKRWTLWFLKWTSVQLSRYPRSRWECSFLSSTWHCMSFAASRTICPASEYDWYDYIIANFWAYIYMSLIIHSQWTQGTDCQSVLWMVQDPCLEMDHCFQIQTNGSDQKSCWPG